MMITEFINEGNKLLQEFMGKDNPCDDPDSNYNHLMWVIEKILTLDMSEHIKNSSNVHIFISNDYIAISVQKYHTGILEYHFITNNSEKTMSFIERLYKCVIVFINWYNTIV